MSMLLAFGLVLDVFVACGMRPVQYNIYGMYGMYGVVHYYEKSAGNFVE